MPWVRLDDQFPDHPKVVRVGPMAAWLYVCGLAYCNRYLTDGFIPAGQVRRLADLDDAGELTRRLVNERLWEPADGGFKVHDYHEYQPTREKAEATSEARAEAGRKGGKQRASNLLEHGLEPSKQNREAKSNPVPGPLPQEESIAKEQVESREHVSRTHAPKPPRFSKQFDAFWSLYPRKENKADAWRVWEKLGPSGDDLDAIMAGLDRWLHSRQWRTDGIYPHASTWLNKRRWDDEPEMAGVGARASPNGSADAIVNGLKRFGEHHAADDTDDGFGLSADDLAQARGRRPHGGDAGPRLLGSPRGPTG